MQKSVLRTLLLATVAALALLVGEVPLSTASAGSFADGFEGEASRHVIGCNEDTNISRCVMRFDHRQCGGLHNYSHIDSSRKLPKSKVKF